MRGQINTRKMMQALLALAHKKGIIVVNGLEVEKINDLANADKNAPVLK